MKFINIGFGNILNEARIIAVVSPESNPIKRIVSNCKENGMLIDATQGRKTKSVIMMDSNHVVLSYLSAEAITGKINVEGMKNE